MILNAFRRRIFGRKPRELHSWWASLQEQSRVLNKDGIAAFSAIRGSALRSLDREGHRTALLIGFIARKVDSLAVGIVSGLAVGAFFAFLVALGNGYYWQMMLPGAAP